MDVTESNVHVTDKQKNIKNISNKKYIDENKKLKKCRERIIRNNEKGDITITLNFNDTEELNYDDDNANFTEITYKSNIKKDTRAITILGDSTIKDLQAHKMKRSLGRNEKIFVKSFSDATVADMVDYARQTVRKE